MNPCTPALNVDRVLSSEKVEARTIPQKTPLGKAVGWRIAARDRLAARAARGCATPRKRICPAENSDPGCGQSRGEASHLRCLRRLRRAPLAARQAGGLTSVQEDASRGEKLGALNRDVDAVAGEPARCRAGSRRRIRVASAVASGPASPDRNGRAPPSNATSMAWSASSLIAASCDSRNARARLAWPRGSATWNSRPRASMPQPSLTKPR